MGQAETRAVNRCTYTPVVNSPEEEDGDPNFQPVQPFAMLAVLRTVFDDPEIGQTVLGSGSPPQFASVLRKTWAGDTGGAIAELSGMRVADVLRFGHNALDSVEKLYRKAQTDIATVVKDFPKELNPEEIDSGELFTKLGKRSPVTMKLLSATRTGVFDRAGIAAPRLKREPQPENETELPAFSAPLARSLTTSPSVSRLLGHVAQQLEAAARKRDILRTLDLLGTAEPLGFLHLERLQFTPVDYALGELVYSLPLVPGETVRVSHREWSRTETEYATLVATSLETAREDALAEKSELAESTSTQQQHTSAFNSSVTASGGFGPVQVSASVGYSASNSDGRSRTSSSKHAQEITKRASSRSKEEHKVTFRVTTTREQEDTSFRELTNTTDAPVRWDYHRLMKRWKIDLYRYDIRLTYDVILPEPGSYLLRKYLEIAEIERDLGRPFVLRGNDRVRFHGNPREIRPSNWEALSALYDVSLEPPPEPRVKAQANAEQSFSTRVVGESYLTISLPEGYRFVSIEPDLPRPVIRDTNGNRLGHIETFVSLNHRQLRRQGESNTFDWRYGYDWSEEGGTPEEGSTLAIGLTGFGVPTRKLIDEWQQAQYGRILDAAKARFEAWRQRRSARREQLVAELDREDALALRKIEREEIMKGVLRWVLGHRFEFFPRGLDLDLDYDEDLDYYSQETGRVFGAFFDEDRQKPVMTRYQQQIRFLQTAIEWENVNYILYPYFWTDPDRWSFKQDVYHPDFEHRAFLRAGAARVVLTLRPSFEKAFLTFMETGKLDRLLDADHKYMTVAEEMKTYATTNNRYTTAANEEKEENRVDTWYEFTPTGALDVVAGHTLGPG